MKRVIFALGILLLFACSKSNDSTSSSNPISTPTPIVTPTFSPYSLTNTTISGFTIPNISTSQIQTAINGAVAGTIIYLKDNVEHMVIPGTLFFNYPLIPVIHLIKVGSTWQYENSYSEAAMGAGRNYECIDSTNQTWVYADTGLELSSGTWPFGNILVMKTSGNKLSWNTISNIKSFYHSVSSGDLNNDGLKDIIGLHMGQYGNWGDALHPYMQNSDGSFSENRNLFSSNYTSWAVNKGSGAVLIKNLLGNKYPDIIRADYGFNSSYQKPTDRYSFIILSYDSLQKKYDISRNPGPIGVFSNPDRGATSVKSADFNKDGFLDLAIATEGTNYTGIEIWMNDGKGNFTPSGQKLEYSFNQLQFREFNVVDFDNDGYPDILLNPFVVGGGSQLFETSAGVNISSLIWKNNGGILGSYSKSINIPNIQPVFMKAFFINNKVVFFGLQGNSDGSFVINEVQLN